MCEELWKKTNLAVERRPSQESWAFHKAWPCRRWACLSCQGWVCQLPLFSLIPAALWLNPRVASPPFESQCPCVREERRAGKRSGCAGHSTTCVRRQRECPSEVCILPRAVYSAHCSLLALPLVPRLCVCWGLVWPVLAHMAPKGTLPNWRMAVVGEMSVHKLHSALHWRETGLSITQTSLFAPFWMQISPWAGRITTLFTLRPLYPIRAMKSSLTAKTIFHPSKLW